MSNSAFRIHGAGHGLADYIYADMDLASPQAQPYLSRAAGDGGISLGGLVFQPDFLDFAGKAWEIVLADLRRPSLDFPIFNAGGPALVSLVAASQFLKPSKVPVTYYGLSGDDVPASQLRHLLAQTPLDLTCFRQRTGRSPATIVGVDPAADGGAGERFFVHDPGSVHCDPSILGESFFQATFNVYAGTAPLPALHSALPELLAKGRHRGALNVLATVYDFAAEKAGPGQTWSLGVGDAYPEIDLLVSNAYEIQKLAGVNGIEAAVTRLINKGLTAAIVTQGEGPVYYRSQGGVFGQAQGYASAHAGLAEKVKNRKANPGDTIGAGDNFLGGVLSDLMFQILSDDFYPKGEVHVEKELLRICPLRLRHAIEFGIVSGGMACLQYGGVRIEKSKAENLARVRQLIPNGVPAGRPW